MQDVRWIELIESDTLSVKIDHCLENLMERTSSLTLSQSTLLPKIFHDSLTLETFANEVNVSLIFENLYETNDCRVIELSYKL